MEYITIETSLPNTDTCIMYFCYRPPSFSPDAFFSDLSLSISQTSNVGLILVLGDFNAKHPHWTTGSANTAGRHLFSLLQNFSLTQCVADHTRYSNDGETCSVLDLVLTNRPELIESVSVSDPISDHCLVTAKLATPPPSSTKCQKRTFLDFNRADWESLRRTLLTAPLLAAIQGTPDVSIAADVWESMFVDILRQHIPSRTITVRHNNKVWMTKELRILARNKHRLFRKARSSRSPDDWRAYCRYRNACTAKFRSARATYLSKKHEELATATDGTHRWWNLAKRLARISSPNQHPPIPDLVTDDFCASTDLQKATLLADYFSTQCTVSSEDSHLDTLGAPFPLPESHPELDFPPISEITVLRALQRLSVHKATAHPLINNRVLRECAPFITPSLSYLFNLSVSTGIFPTAWKRATVVPLFKHRGKAADPSNYRPVSLLPAVGKVLDSIQSHRLLHYLLHEKLLSPHQFGFLPGKSTTMQLVYILDRWLRALDQGRNISAVFLDFRKAFDRVWHNGLLHKLMGLGLSQWSIAWISSYLTNRFLAVRVGAAHSDDHNMSCGVPQGSHLGPILFTVFINDLPATITIPTEVYADDTLLHHSHRKSPTCHSYHELQDAIRVTEEWALSWRGQFGHAKTRILTTNREMLLHAVTPTIDNSPIEIVSLHRHLGITFTDTLKWSAHAHSILATASKRAGLLRLMSRSLPFSVTNHLYIHYVRPVMDYASPCGKALSLRTMP